MSYRRELPRRISSRLDMLQDSQRASSLVHSSQQMSVLQRQFGRLSWSRSRILSQFFAVAQGVDWISEVMVDMARFMSAEIWYIYLHVVVYRLLLAEAILLIRRFGEACSKSFLRTWTHVHVCYMSSSVRLSVCLSSVCLSSVTFVHPTQPIEIFGNVSAPFNTLLTWRHPGKILRRSSQGNSSVGRLNQRVVEKCSDFGPLRGYISETVVS